MMSRSSLFLIDNWRWKEKLTGDQKTESVDHEDKQNVNVSFLFKITNCNIFSLNQWL